jgi:uncharacterized protein (DUF885 family)
MKKIVRITSSVLAISLAISSIASCGGGQPAERITPSLTQTESIPTTTLITTSDQLPTSSPISSVADVTKQLRGLSIDDFFEESYKQLLLRSPEYLTAMGMSEAYGVRNDQLNNLSDAYLRETADLQVAILELLRGYNRFELTPNQQLSVDVYEWYLDDLVRGQEFMYYNYPIHHFLISYHDELIRLFTEYHTIATREDVEDYISRLMLVDDQVAQLLEGMVRREVMGIIPPKFILEMARSVMYGYLGIHSPDPSSIRGESLSVYGIFRDRLESIDWLSESEKAEMLEAALDAINASFIPAYIDLLAYLDDLVRIATDDAGVWKFPNGDAYYAYMLRSQTSTDMTPEEIHNLGLSEVDRIQEEMRAVFEELGYPQDADLGELMDRAIQDGGYYNISTPSGKENLIKVYEEMLEEVDLHLDGYFNIRPQGEVVVIGHPEFGVGGYYVSAPMDGSRPAAFHTGIGGSRAYKFNMPTVAYHEAIPGHHFQIAIAQEMDLPLFRNDVVLNAYAEGWALYAERLAWEMGLYDDDPYGNIGRLHLELLRAVRLVTDTGIHTMRWSREEAKAYMNGALGDPSGRWSHEVDRYIVLPAQATGYKIGMLKILELREKAMGELGDQFDIKEFHTVILGNGSLPLEILERVVQDYIDTKLASK